MKTTVLSNLALHALTVTSFPRCDDARRFAPRPRACASLRMARLAPRVADARSRALCAVDARSRAPRAAVTHGWAQFAGLRYRKGHLDFCYSLGVHCYLVYNAIKFLPKST